MKRRFRVALVVLVIAVIGGLIWMEVRPRNRMFHGEPESVWIESINSADSDPEFQQWKNFGSEGVPLLVKGLQKGGGRWERFYFKLWPKLPSFLGHRLAKPVDSIAVRTRSALILRHMGNDAQTAIPALLQALDDDCYGVRMNAIAALNALSPGMGKAKSDVLPRLIEATRDTFPGVRNNAILGLKNYPEQAGVVIPIVVKALSDADPNVRFAAIKSLVQLDSATAQKTGVPELLKLVNDGKPEVRLSATKAIKAIDPEAAAKAGMQ
ncbi:MAG: repeat protein [Pedosphaera sp.]|nr:repeat protein [Pedosphaera sp.]